MRVKKRRILITGVTGLIGSHLLDELLSRGETVCGLDNLAYGKMQNIQRHLKNKRFTFYRADILDPMISKKITGPIDIILHMAAVKKGGEGEPSLPTLLVNGEGTERMLKFAEHKGAKFILGSTSDVYGISAKVPFCEEGESVLGPSTAKRWAYAVSKLYSEHLAMSYFKDHHVPVVILRYFGTFSERASTQWSGGHIPIFIESILNGRDVVIHGDGTQTRSMAHISDIVRGTLLAMEETKAVGEILNLGNDEEVSVLESAKMIHRLSGSKKSLKIRYIPFREIFGTYKEIPRRIPDLRKAKKILGYEPQVTFEEALKKVINERMANR